MASQADDSYLSVRKTIDRLPSDEKTTADIGALCLHVTAGNDTGAPPPHHTPSDPRSAH